MDAQGPIDGSGDPVHPQVTRACYPAPGIELELGETPVMRCSRWEPDGEQARLDSIRDAFLKKPEGKAFADKLAAFEQAYVEAAEDNRSVDAPPAFAGSVGELESHLGDADDDLIDEGTVQL